MEIKSIFLKAKRWIIKNENDIIILIGVILISLFSFALGFIVAKQQEKEPLKIESKYNYKNENSSTSRCFISRRQS